MLTIKIRFTSGEIKELNEVPADSTILQVKSLLQQRKLCDAEPEQQRLIFKGRILANDQNLSEANVQEGSTLHFVKSSSKPVAPAPAPVAAAPAPAAMPDFASLLGAGGGGGGGEGGDAQGRVIMEMLQSNPAVRNMMDRNPEMARMLQSPEVLQQMMQMNNPAMRDEILRNHDRQLANLESIPGGQAALLRMMNEVGEMDGMFDQTPSRPTVTRPNTTPAANSTPEAAPMPNPWSAPARPPAAAANNPWAPAAASASPFGMPAFGSGGGMPNMQMMQEMMQAPGMQERMQEMMRNPEQVLQQMQMMQQLMGNDNLAALQQSVLQMMQQPGAMEQVQQSMQGLMRGGGGGGNNINAGLPSDLAELEALIAQGGLMGSSTRAASNNQPPETRFADQLVQLEGMGFTDRAKNVRALIATNGNVHAAVERLLM